MSYKGVNGVLNYPAPNGQGSFVDTSGGVAGISITSHGSYWYWTVTAIMMVSTIAFLGLSLKKPRSKRIFHYITASITMIASLAYFSMASNIGWAPTAVEFIRGGNVAGLSRQVFYVRYIDWVFTTPLLLLDLLLTANLPWPTILFVLLVDEIMIVTGLSGALVYSTFKWGYFVFGCVALVYIGFVLLFEARTSANRLGKDVSRAYITTGAWTFMLWTLYPIAWGLCEGGNYISPDSEAVFYGILDVLAKPVFGTLLLWGHRNIDPARLGLHIRGYEDEATMRDTKGAEAGYNTNGTTSGTNGTTTHTNGTSATHGHTGTNGATNNLGTTGNSVTTGPSTGGAPHVVSTGTGGHNGPHGTHAGETAHNQY